MAGVASDISRIFICVYLTLSVRVVSMLICFAGCGLLCLSVLLLSSDNNDFIFMVLFHVKHAQLC